MKERYLIWGLTISVLFFVFGLFNCILIIKIGGVGLFDSWRFGTGPLLGGSCAALIFAWVYHKRRLSNFD